MRNKLLFALFLSASLAFAYSGGDGSYENPYEIATLADLQELQTAVNSGTSYSGSYFLQTADIDMTSAGNWQGIGTYSPSTNVFSGSYDGDGYCFTNLTMNVSIPYQRSWHGFFVWLSGATIANVRLYGNVNYIANGVVSYHYCGTLYGRSDNNSILEGIENYCDITYTNSTANDTGNFHFFLGALGGTTLISSALTYTDLKNYGNIVIDSPMSYTFGGVLANFSRGNQNDTATMKGFENHGNFSVKSSSTADLYACAISGISYSSNAGGTTFESCKNFGNITITGGVWCANGILTAYNQSNNSPKFKYCENKGNISLYGGDGHIQSFAGKGVPTMAI